MDHNKSNFDVLGVPVSNVQIATAIVKSQNFIDEGIQECAYVTFTGMHGVMESQKNCDILDAHKNAWMVCPDGKPLVLIGRLRGYDLARRVYGPEFMREFCRTTGAKYRHFFYGSTPETVEPLISYLIGEFSIHVVGTICPPFRATSDNEIKDYARQIKSAGADIVWVGLSTPKQELFMSQIKPHLNQTILFGVGAAFDFLSGKKRSAPIWMQENGLEWLFRLLSEPKRLWRRYIIQGGKFMRLIFIEELRRLMK